MLIFSHLEKSWTFCFTNSFFAPFNLIGPKKSLLFPKRNHATLSILSLFRAIWVTVYLPFIIFVILLFHNNFALGKIITLSSAKSNYGPDKIFITPNYLTRVSAAVFTLCIPNLLGFLRVEMKKPWKINHAWKLVLSSP